MILLSSLTIVAVLLVYMQIPHSGGDELLLFAEYDTVNGTSSIHPSIHLINLTNGSLSFSSYSVPGHGPYAIAYDPVEMKIYWSDFKGDDFWRMNVDGSARELIHKHFASSYIDDMEVDPESRLLYYVDSGRKTIGVMGLNGFWHGALLANLDEPVALALDPGGGRMYWSDWGANYQQRSGVGKLMSANLDGKNMSVLVLGLYRPFGLTLDYKAKKMYWCDLSYVETANFDGSNKVKLITSPAPSRLFGITSSEDYLFLTDNYQRSVLKVKKDADTNATFQIFGHPVFGHLRGITYHKTGYGMDTVGVSPCSQNNGGCSHICLAIPHGAKCACHSGQKCEDVGDSFAVVTDQTTVYQMRLSTYNARPLPLPNVKKAVDVAYDPKHRFIYVADEGRAAISKVMRGGNHEEVVAYLPQGSLVVGIAFDYTSQLVYYTDRGNNVIGAVSADGGKHTTVLRNLHSPRGITLDLRERRIFWTSHGDGNEVATISAANMDGSMKQVILNSTLHWPNGIAYDHGSNSIFYVDGWHKTINKMSANGSNINNLRRNIGIHYYGITVDSRYIYYTAWNIHGMIRASKIDGSNAIFVGPHKFGKLFGLIVHEENYTVNVSDISPTTISYEWSTISETSLGTGQRLSYGTSLSTSSIPRKEETDNQMASSLSQVTITIIGSSAGGAFFGISLLIIAAILIKRRRGSKPQRSLPDNEGSYEIPRSTFVQANQFNPPGAVSNPEYQEIAKNPNLLSDVEPIYASINDSAV